jgi:hypothetical protein
VILAQIFIIPMGGHHSEEVWPLYAFLFTVAGLSFASLALQRVARWLLRTFKDDATSPAPPAPPAR